MVNTSENNKRIAKNTLLLYVRMLFTMAVSLYTSRVILNVLGVEDFGIYNVVGGVVAMFSLISGALSSAIMRFITFELGTGNKENLKKVFSSAVTIQLAFALIIVALAEAVGVWFLNIKMNIPEVRINAANWVFQFSLLTFVINLISVPYNASIIAHEKMSVFAYISIFEAVSKLALAFLIMISPIDKLVFYALLICSMAFIIRLIYGAYCKRNFEECNYKFIVDKVLLKRMFSFAGWNFIGSSSAILRDQGGNVILNLFCGPISNAARGISAQVNSAVYGFALNFMTALNPQIIKSYANKDFTYMMALIVQGARFSCYLLLILSLPILINTQTILHLWLDIVPRYSVIFVQLTLIFAISESISGPLITATQATGRIRNYQIVVGGIQMLNLPISYIILKNGGKPEALLVIAIALSQCCLFARLYMLRRMIGLSIKKFIRKVYLNIIFVALSSLVFPLIIYKIFIEHNFYVVIGISMLTVICTILSILYIGCNNEERNFLINKTKNLKKIFKI